MNKQKPLPERRDLFISQGVDLAISEKSRGDWFVIFTIGIDDFGNRYVLNIFRERRLTFSMQVAAVEKRAISFNSNIVIVESNAYQQALYQELRDKTDVPVVSFTTTGINKKSEETGLPSLALEIENGKWHFPYGDHRTRELIDILFEELTSYPVGKFSDCMMAMWFASLGARRNSPNIREL